MTDDKKKPVDLGKERKLRSALSKELKKVTDEVEPKGSLQDIKDKIDKKKG